EGGARECTRPSKGRPLLQSRPYESDDFHHFVNRLVSPVKAAILAHRSPHTGSQSVACPQFLRGGLRTQPRRDPQRRRWVLGNCFGTALSCSSRQEGRYPTSATPSTLGRSSG